MTLPKDDRHGAFSALSDRGLRKTAEHHGIPSAASCPRAELVDALSAFESDSYLIGACWGFSVTDFRAVVKALGLAATRTHDRRDLQTMFMRHLDNHSDGEKRRRARLAEIGPMSMTPATLLAEGRRLVRAHDHLQHPARVSLQPGAPLPC